MAPPAAVGEYHDDGQVLTFGSVEVEAIYVPGHSAGSIAYYCRGEGALFTGDALFAGSIGRTDLPGGNLDRLKTGITKRLLTLPDETVVYPGHGETTTIGREKSTNPWLS
jgi:glyoxylase-like metal-dependent hydrolase (beta-lactamase superfamily II)